MFVPAQATGSLDKMAADQNAERVFLILLAKFNQQLPRCQPQSQQDLRANGVCQDPEAEGFTTRAFERAMSRLLDTTGSTSRWRGHHHAAAPACRWCTGPSSQQAINRQESGTFQRPTNPLTNWVPTPYQPPVCSNPLITPWRWNRPTQGWNPAVLFTPLQGFLRQTRAARAQLIRRLNYQAKSFKQMSGALEGFMHSWPYHMRWYRKPLDALEHPSPLRRSARRLPLTRACFCRCICRFYGRGPEISATSIALRGCNLLRTAPAEPSLRAARPCEPEISATSIALRGCNFRRIGWAKRSLRTGQSEGWKRKTQTAPPGGKSSGRH